ncbi:rifin PIR protein, putative [Plasmodium reichenowi]|uniref:Rifin PIR protein, putative n=1 Tax=Plasmodium reichenowi TaxID=5854 RepID=A0A2P9DBD1_PLARE|nr:rifin PIR protein, putative [Plasmodium reichenowi]
MNYFKILLFFILLNILVSSPQKNPSITQRLTPIYTSRVLSEKDAESSNYDKDADMKSVKEQFDDRTSQRLREYDERLQEKRQKRKEERDKNIEEIIKKDRMEKSLADKVEKGCLRCGCALGGGVLPVWGLVSGLWYGTLSQYATKLAIQKGIEKGIQMGLEKVTAIARMSLSDPHATIPEIKVLETLIAGKFNDEVTLYGIFECINNNIKGSLRNTHDPFFTTVNTMVKKGLSGFNKDYSKEAAAVTEAVAKGEAAEFAAKTGVLSSTIIASVVAIVVIVLIMVIIYLVLRYRRKKKMKKKAHYTKLLNQ